MHIRPYAPEDWLRVRDIHDLCKPDEMAEAVPQSAILPLDQDRPTLDLFRRSEVFVMEDGGAVIAFSGHIGGYISWLCVHPAHRRQGAATALLTHILARIDGVAALNVGKHNLPARTLYGRFGFTVQQDFVGTFNGHDVEVLTLQRPSSDVK